MKTVGLRWMRALTFLPLTTAFGCQQSDPADEADAAVDDDVEFRVGVTEILVDTIAGEHACFSLHYACEQPESARITVDGTVRQIWGRQEFEDGSVLDAAPASYCYPTHRLSGAAPHVFGLTAVCNGVSVTDTVSANTTAPAFRIARIAPNQTHYTQAVRQVQIDVDAVATTGITITANFASIDSGYVGGAEQITPLGGGKYRVTYTISINNTRAAGDYLVPVAVTRSGVTKTRSTKLRWLPLGAPRVGLNGAALVAAGAPARSVKTGTLISAATLSPATMQTVWPTPSLFETLSDDVGGRPFTFTVSTPVALGDRVRVEMRDNARSGGFLGSFHATPVAPLHPTLTSYAISGSLNGNPVPYGQPNASISFRTVYDDGTASPWTGATGFSWPGQQGTITANGRLRYEYEDCVPDFFAEPLENTPQYRPSSCSIDIRVARRLLVEMTNECGQSHRAYVLDDGTFTLRLPDACGNETYSVRVYSATRKERGKRIAIAAWDGAAIDDSGDLTTDSDDYAVHSAELYDFVPGFGNHTEDLGTLTITLANDHDMAWSAHLVDTVATGLEYFQNYTDPDDYDGINICWSSTGPDLPDKPGGTEPYNIFLSESPSLIYLRRISKTAFPVTHELSHYVHAVFMRDANINYGRFGEPMANTTAAMVLGTSYMSLGPDQVFETLDVNGAYKDDVGDGTPGFLQSNLQFFPAPADYEDCDNRDGCCVHEDNDEPEKIPLCVLGSSGYTWRIYQDLHDGVDNEPLDEIHDNDMSGDLTDYGTFDSVNGNGGSNDPTTHKLADVLFRYLGGGANATNSDYDDRGTERMDPADVVDGMMCRGHMTQIQSQELLQDVMDYAYDYDAPASCD